MGLRLSLVWLAACSAGPGVGPDASEPAWKLLQQQEPAALLSVWGSSSDDVWVTGGRTELAGGPTLMHYTDHTWSRIDPGPTNLDLWWVFGFAGGDVFFGGTGGTILRYRNGAFENMVAPGTGTIFGIWGATSNDLWAVGDGGANGGLVWHYDGLQWSPMSLPAGVPNRVFKVHGQRSEEVWIACADGSTLHWNGLTLERQLTGVVAPLFSIVTTPERTVAVGGASGMGQIAEHVVDPWTIAPLASPAIWRGAAAGDADLYVVGEYGAVAKREASGWTLVHQTLTQGNFHAAWVDPAGGLWGVGGAFDRLPLTADGFLVYYGADDIGEVQP